MCVYLMLRVVTCACVPHTGRAAYLLPLASALASVSPGFCPYPVVELVGPRAVLPLRCPLYSRL